MAQLEEVIRTGFEGLNQGQINKSFSDVLIRKYSPGIGEFRKRYPDARWEVVHVVEQGNNVGFQYRATATSGDVGRQVSWTGSGIARVHEGRIVSLDIKEDSWARKLQLGQLPDLATEVMTGTWIGSLFGINFTLQATQPTGTNNFTGTLNIPGFGNFPVTGTNNYPNVQMSGNSGTQTIQFQGTWTGPNQITGDLIGIANNVVLNRQ